MLGSEEDITHSDITEPHIA